MKEAVSKSLVRRTEITYRARLREISWHKATKSNNYHFCRSRANVADIWRERACTLSVEVSQYFYLHRERIRQLHTELYKEKNITKFRNTKISVERKGVT